MKLPTIFLLAILSVGCNNGQNKSSTADSTDNSSIQAQTTMLCFQRLDGAAKRDTSIFSFKITGDSVKGSFNHNPYEKDSRKGTIAGIKNGDTIKALWSFMQEGMNDTISVEFKLQGGNLYQKTFGIDKNTGRQKLTDTSTFSINYRPVDCT